MSALSEFKSATHTAGYLCERMRRFGLQGQPAIASGAELIEFVDRIHNVARRYCATDGQLENIDISLEELEYIAPRIDEIQSRGTDLRDIGVFAKAVDSHLREIEEYFEALDL